MNNLQEKLLSMVKWFHTFCQANHLRYYIIGGTMLGAVRHHGFIPWDDDIDVAMPRKDYEIFLQNAHLDAHEFHYIVESTHSGQKDFLYPYAKIYDATTTLIERCRPPIKRGIYIDVFPLDGIGETIQSAYQNYLPLEMKRHFLNTRVCVLNKNRKWYKNASIILSRAIPDCFVENHQLVAQIEQLCKTYDFDKSAICGNLVGAWGKREILPRTYLGTPTEYHFEDTTLLGPEDYHRYLTNLYGNYMQLPPPEKQISHHNYILCDLNQSFLAYEE